MKKTKNHKLQAFLDETQLIDFSNKFVQEKAQFLAEGTSSVLEVARNCFLFVRDEIHHSGDVIEAKTTTYKASDVLVNKTGWCYAKSILLCALLRANNIACGFCYQRLSCSEYKKDVYCLHGYNAIYLPEFGWYKVDARGNKEGVDAQFNPPYEKLAFELQENEFELPEIYENPLPEVVEALQKYTSYEEMINNFPDVKNS